MIDTVIDETKSTNNALLTYSSAKISQLYINFHCFSSLPVNSEMEFGENVFGSCRINFQFVMLCIFYIPLFFVRYTTTHKVMRMSERLNVYRLGMLISFLLFSRFVIMTSTHRETAADMVWQCQKFQFFFLYFLAIFLISNSRVTFKCRGNN